MATVCCAERVRQLDEHRKGGLHWRSRKGGDAGTGMSDRPDASIVLKIHVRLATGAQACGDILADVTGGGSEDGRVVCVSLISSRCPKI